VARTHSQGFDRPLAPFVELAFVVPVESASPRTRTCATKEFPSRGQSSSPHPRGWLLENLSGFLSLLFIRNTRSPRLTLGLNALSWHRHRKRDAARAAA
jgi:hypothetical protein